MTEKRNIFGLTCHELEDWLESRGYKRFSGRQLFQWIYGKGVYDFGAMTNLSRGLRQELAESAEVLLPRIVKTHVSSDGTVKYLFRLEDKQRIEAVKIPDQARMTLCISSQVGCALGCRFCRTALNGFARNLTTGEILAQVALIRRALLPSEELTNLVLMGMGEPFLNYDRVRDAILILSSELGYEISQKKITISTAGHLPGIYRLADDTLKVRLALSLNSADQKVRERLMPIAQKYPLPELRKGVIYFVHKTRRRITFEYLLISGLTDTMQMAKKLVAYVGDIPCKINLINYNPAPGLPKEFKPSREEDILRFRDYLYPRTPAVTIRASRGRDIEAACGQLAAQIRPE